MIVLDTLLIANGPSDGAVISGQFIPADGDKAAQLILRTLTSDLTIEGDAALLLFNYYRNSGKRIAGAEYATISREAVNTLQLFFEKLRDDDPITERRQMADRCRSIIKSLKVQTAGL